MLVVHHGILPPLLPMTWVKAPTRARPDQDVLDRLFPQALQKPAWVQAHLPNGSHSE